jgi:two-component system chemotaxis sensor kinase CheA
MLLLDCAGIAAMAGLQFGREIAIDDEVVEAEVQRVSALLFDDLDGVRRLVPLAIIDRIEPVAVESIKFSAGRLRLSTENGIIPLVVQGEWTGRQTLSVLRLRDGAAEIGYAIAEALDIVTLPEKIAPSREVGPIAGVVSLEGEQVELLDLYWLFAMHGATRSDEKPPVCLIEGADTAWMKTFLKPVLEGAGYRVATKLKADETAAVILTMNSDTTVAKTGGAPVVRLRHDATASDARESSVYRYDRDGLLAALAVSAGGR